MIHKFKLDSINDIYEVDDSNKLYILNLKALTRDVHEFGISFDGEDYKDDCWLLEIHDNNSKFIEELFYITFDGVREKYCNITPEFRKYILEELKELIDGGVGCVEDNL